MKPNHAEAMRATGSWERTARAAAISSPARVARAKPSSTAEDLKATSDIRLSAGQICSSWISTFDPTVATGVSTRNNTAPSTLPATTETPARRARADSHRASRTKSSEASAGPTNQTTNSRSEATPAATTATSRTKRRPAPMASSRSPSASRLRITVNPCRLLQMKAIRFSP
jgi:hypothetical protein